MELVILMLFCLAIILCVILNISLVYGLLIGLFIFCIYGRHKGFAWREVGTMLWSGFLTAKNIVIIFFFIGVLTALWRASGTISVIICYSLGLIKPQLIVLMAFLLNCLISMLLGSSFATSATMGVISMTLGNAMGANPALLGGAILSGIYVGDRTSPISTSALLTAVLTETNIYDNIKKMVRTALWPFLLSCCLYGVVSFFLAGSGKVLDLAAVFSREMVLHWSAILPALIIIILACFRVQVKLTMGISIIAAGILCNVLQHMDILHILQICLTGYHAHDKEVAALLNGGGIVSMLNVAAIIAISSSYAGIFEGTGLLNNVQTFLENLSKRITPFGGIIVASFFTAMVTCNQTLSTMLTHQLCHKLEPDQATFAISLEDSVIVIAPLIPWNIACAVPLTNISAPNSSIAFAFFLYLLPLFTFIRKLHKQ